MIKEVNYSVDSLWGLFLFILIDSALFCKDAEITWLTRITVQ